MAYKAKLTAATDQRNGVIGRSNQRRKVCVLAYDGLRPFEYGLAVEIFFSKNLKLENWYDFQVIAVDDSPITGIGNISIEASTDLTALLHADLIIMPGWRGIDEKIPPALKDTLVEAHGRGVQIASICTGVFVLAQSGLLDGKRATTHWQYLEDLATHFPQIKVDENVPFVDDDHIITSAGATAGIEMCLHIIRGHYGAKIASIVARRLNVDPQYVIDVEDNALMRSQNRIPRLYQGNISPLLDKIRASINEDWGIERMSEVTRSSARTLQRRFKDSTGHSPHMWLTIERVELAKDLLETTPLNIQQIATATGLKTPETFRHHFKRLTGTSPTKFRAKCA